MNLSYLNVILIISQISFENCAKDFKNDDALKINGLITYCELELCYSSGGICNIHGQCQCMEGYTTTDSTLKHIKCNYQQVSSVKAGLIELLIGCGFGHFYAGRKVNGAIKLTLVIILCGCVFTSIVLIRKIREEVEAEDHPYVSLFVILVAVFKIVIVSWQIIDGFLFFFKIYTDGNGYSLT